MTFISSFEIIKVVFPEPYFFLWIPASIYEAGAVIPDGAKTFFAKRTTTLINGTANLLNNEPKHPPEGIILEIWALENFISVDMFFSTAFLNLVV